MYVKTATLPAIVRCALSRVGYGAPDVNIEPREKVSPYVGGGSGQRGFLLLVDLQAGTFAAHHGSWGGSNMFNPSNAVDLDTSEYTLPEHGLAILGTEGHPRTFATIYAHPAQMAGFLPPVAAPLTADEQWLVNLYCSCTSAGRKDELSRKGWTAQRTEDTVNALVTRGLFSRNKAGAVSVTTDGKNARNGNHW